jgi:hypothetical protein
VMAAPAMKPMTSACQRKLVYEPEPCTQNEPQLPFRFLASRTQKLQSRRSITTCTDLQMP